MSIDEVIKNAVEKALSDKVVSPYPCYANRAEAAKLLGISTQTLDRLFKSGRLSVDRHTTQFMQGGNIMYYLPEILAELAPRGATVMIIGKVA
jgi:hypothetical protein